MKYIRFFLLTIVSVVFIWIYMQNINTPFEQFSDQAQSFLSGRLDIQVVHDSVLRNGKYYWPQGPFPSIFLIPFQIVFGPNFNQSIMQIILIIILFFILYKLAIAKKYNIEDAIYLAFAFLFGSTVVGIISDPRGWFYAQLVAIVWLTALLLEFETNKRPLVLGILLAAIIATRPTAAFILPVILSFFKQKYNLILFLSPIIISILLLSLFNQIRFGNPFDNGYMTNNIGQVMEQLREKGLFSLNHVPANAYYYFLASVQSVTKDETHLIFPFFTYNPWGLSFFLIGPFFLLALKSLKFNDKYIRSLWIVIGITLFVLLAYYAPGVIQFGPRYTADFLPILYLIILYTLVPPLKNWQKNIIVLSALLNIYLLATPLFLR